MQMPPKRPRKRSSSTSTTTSITTEEDGIQCERETKKAGPRRMKAVIKNTTAIKDTLKEFAIETVKLGISGMEAEFLAIKTETQGIGSRPRIAFDDHPDKNRYRDVFCIDETRVKLSWPPGSLDDYIHANYVKGHDGQTRFICTQGPKENTIDDFWRMVWQEKAKSIVMLCNLIETGKKKCEKYWPDDGQPLQLACKLNVRFIKKENLEAHLVLTRLEVTDETGEKLPIEHIQWKDWPDRGVPEATFGIFRLLNRISKLVPSVVHCSAGIGRTGTVVGLDLAYQRLEQGEVPKLDKVIRELREQRHGSVQTDIQYFYMHRLLLMLAEKKKVCSSIEITAFIQQYDSWCKARGF